MITIEAFNEVFVDDLWQVYYSAIRDVCINNYTDRQVKAWAPDDLDRTIWKDKMLEITPFIASIASTIVGYADLQEDGKIDHFYVHGAHQARGVGRALMECILCQGGEWDYLYSDVSFTAKPFFEHYGFSVLKVQEFEVRGEKLQNNLMRRSRLGS